MVSLPLDMRTLDECRLGMSPALVTRMPFVVISAAYWPILAMNSAGGGLVAIAASLDFSIIRNGIVVLLSFSGGFAGWVTCASRSRRAAAPRTPRAPG